MNGTARHQPSDEPIIVVDTDQAPDAGAPGARLGLPAWGQASWSIIGLIGAVVLLAWLVPRILLLAVPIVVAGLATALLLPLSDVLQRRGVPRVLATWLVLLAAIGCVAGAAALLVPAVTNDSNGLQTSLSDGVTNVENWLVSGPLGFSQTAVDGWATDLRTQTTSLNSTLSQGALSTAPLVLHAVTGTILSLVLTFFFMKDGASLGSQLQRRLAPDKWPRVANSWSAITGFARGLVINGLVNATVLGIALAILGVPFALPLAAITFAASFIPVAGAIVSGLLAALIALVAMGPLTAAIVVVVTVVIHHLEGYIVGPIIIGRRTGLHPVSLILSLLVGSIVAGIPGAFIAGPIAATVSGWYASNGAAISTTPDLESSPTTTQEPQVSP